MKIFHKVFLGMFVSAILPLSIAGYWTIRIVRDENRQRVNLILSSSSQNLADAVERYISTNVNSIRISLKDFSPERDYILSDIISAFENVKYIGINGFSVGDVSFSNKEYGEGIFLEENSIFFSSRDIKVALSDEPVLKILYSFSVGDTGRAFLRKIAPDKPLSELVELNENGKTHIAAYRRVKNSDFAVFVSIDKEEVERLWFSILYQLLFWLGVGTVLALTFAFLITGGITTPLRKISETAREYAKLDFSKKLVYRGKDEVSEVVKAFSAMSDEIERAWNEIRMWNLELEKRVEERTIQLKKTHDDLLVAEKIAAVGTLGAGVSHEINNPLAASLGFVQILKRKTTDEQISKYLEKILDNLTRVKAIVERLRSFSEVQLKADYKPLKPKEVVQKTVSNLEEFAQNKMKSIQLTSQDVHEIYADEEQLETAIHELLKNAILSSKSTVQVRLYQKDKDVYIEIEDDGEEGIPKELHTRIFEPFFTLKKWEGIGLGLTIARTIIQNIRGTIELESSPGRTVFKVVINTEKNREIGEFLLEEVKRMKIHLV